MSNSEIALAVGCSEMMIYRAIGPMPAEMRKKIFQVPADMLGTFIEELQAIQKNMNTVQSAPFWG